MADAPLTICPKCGQITRGNCCRLKAAARANFKDNRRYRRASWRRTRKAVIARAHGLCEACQRQGVLTAGTEVDHLTPATEAPELFHELDNLQLLCKRCHSQKTMRGA